MGARPVVTHLIKHDVFLPIIDLTLRESRRDNLLSSSCQDLFEFIRRENLRDLIHHIMTNHEAKIRALESSSIVGTRFQNFIRRWEQNIEPPPVEEDKKQAELSNTRRWGQGRAMEHEEEDWFNGSDDEDVPPSPPPPWIQQQLASQPTLKRKRHVRTSFPLEWPSRRRQPPSPTPTNSPIPQSPGLVDYEGDDDPPPSAERPSENQKPPESTRPHPVLPSIGIASSLHSHGPGPINSAHSLRVKAPQPIKLPSLEGTSELLQAAAAADVDDQAEAHVTSEPAALPRRMDKRRREEDDDDEMMARLAAKGKRPSVVTKGEKMGMSASGIGKLTPGKEEGLTKKIKLKLGSIGIGMSSTKSPSLSPATATTTATTTASKEKEREGG